MKRKLIPVILVLSALCWAMTIKEAQEFTLDGKYAEAISGLHQTLNQERDPRKKFDLALEIGDIYLDQLRSYPEAESVYREMIAAFPKAHELAGVHYRLGITYEKQERYIDAANAYQAVVIHYPKSSFANDASQAIERCFKKNYRDVVALVDSFPITRLEFDERIAGLSDQARADSVQRQNVIDGFITERLIFAAARKAGLAERTDVKDQLADARKGITFRELYRRTILDQISVKPSELKPYYKTHLKEFTVPEQLRAREIVTKTKDEADTVLTLLKTGPLTFDSLARLRSIDPTKTRGGDMGFFPRGRNPAIDTIAFGLKPGDLSGIIQTDKGFVILKIEARRAESKKKFEDVKSDIETRLKREKHEKIYKQFMTDLKKPATIDTFPLDRDTLAVVNQHPITQADLDRLLARIPPYGRSNYQTPEGKRQLIDQIITERLLLAQILARKLWLPDSVQLQFTDAYKSILARALHNQITVEQVPIDSVQIADFYKAHKADYKTPEQVKAREIIVKSRNEAETVLKRLRTVSFDSLAKEVSIAPDKQTGGDMGFFIRGDKPKELEETAFRLKPGQTSGIIALKDGFAVIKVEEHKQASFKPLSEVKDQIEFSLRNQQQEKLWNDFMTGLKQQAKIQIFLTPEQPEKNGGK
jgi:parvulin-like peptidyl-prolyl isomerase